MNRTILVPIDISDSELTQRVIAHVEAEAKIDDAKVHFLTVIPSLPYYASLGLAYSAELPAMDDLKAEAKSQLEAIIKKFNLPLTACRLTLQKALLKIKFWKWPKNYRPIW
ncbi:Universal stress protein F [Salmonella enterica]|nr:Universal stress protein F [Salmonella enterica]